MKIKRMNKIQLFFTSLLYFLQLYSAGFRITAGKSKGIDLVIYRFWWKDKVIDAACDIDKVGNHYNTVAQGRVTRLD